MSGEHGRLCTATPGVVHPTGPHIVLCPPESDCTDAIVTPGARRKWRTASGGTAAAWYAKHRHVPMSQSSGQLEIAS